VRAARSLTTKEPKPVNCTPSPLDIALEIASVVAFSARAASALERFAAYFIEQSLEAGLCLEGWEVKSLRDNKVQIKESYVILKNNELFL
jgi:hypothetical protein